MHMKPIGVAAGGVQYLLNTEDNNMDGVVVAEENADFANQFINAIAQKRFWDRT